MLKTPYYISDGSRVICTKKRSVTDRLTRFHRVIVYNVLLYRRNINSSRSQLLLVLITCHCLKQDVLYLVYAQNNCIIVRLLFLPINFNIKITHFMIYISDIQHELISIVQKKLDENCKKENRAVNIL